MGKSSYEWKILDWDEKFETKKKNNSNNNNKKNNNSFKILLSF